MGFGHPHSVGNVVGSIGSRADRGSRNLRRLLTNPASLPNSGVADILDDAKAAFVKRYWEIKQGISTPEYQAAPRTTLTGSLTGHSIRHCVVFLQEGER